MRGNVSRIVSSVLCFSALVLAMGAAHAQKAAPLKKESELHNLWKLTPAGVGQKIADMPLGCALSPDGKLLAIVNAGYNDYHLYITDAATGTIKQTLPLDSAWNGITWSRDGGTLYVSGGGLPKVHVFTRNGDTLQA